MLAAIAEPSRLRIVELLAAAPRTVGELAKLLDARQPQTTKHLQTLESAGVITIHRLGRRRVASLRRESIRELSEWLNGLAVSHPSEPVLQQYQQAIEREQALIDSRQSQLARTFEVRRTIPAAVADVWQAWTTPALIRRWWAPDHFEVAECEIEPIPGGILRIVIQESDGARYSSAGQILSLHPNQQLEFTQAPLGPDDQPLFTTVCTVTFDSDDNRTDLSMTINVSGISEEAAPALAGIPFGWEQCLNKLARLMSDEESTALT